MSDHDLTLLIITYDFYHLKVIASNRSAWRNMFLKDERLDFYIRIACLSPAGLINYIGRYNVF